MHNIFNARLFFLKMVHNISSFANKNNKQFFAFIYRVSMIGKNEEFISLKEKVERSLR